MSSVIELHDEENFNNDVLNSDVPVLVDFWAEWCGPCKQLSPTVEEIAEANKDKIKALINKLNFFIKPFYILNIKVSIVNLLNF